MSESPERFSESATHCPAPTRGWQWEAVVRRFERAWFDGQQPAIEDYLVDTGPGRIQLFLELIHADLEFRLRAGEPIGIEFYLDKHADALASPEHRLRLVHAEVGIRRALGQEVKADAYRQRFPDLAHELEKLIGDDRRAPPPAAMAARINCPHCRNPIEILIEPGDEELVCPSCGSSFHLDQDRTRTWRGKLPQLGRFQLLDKLGTGAFGTVYKAYDSTLDRHVAVKIPRTGTIVDERDEERFLHEARSAAQLTHPCIVPIYDVGRSEHFSYIVSELIQGVTLADSLTAKRYSFRESAELIAKVAEALEYSHRRGVVHRDLKPSNIMLSADGTPRVMDFGLAKRDAGEITMTLDGQVLGTPAYMSPEQARGEGHAADSRSDVYSLGVILFELLTGERPFRGNQRMLIHQVLTDEPPSPRQFNAAVPRDLDTIALKCLEKDPQRRFQTAGELAADLGRFLEGQPILARPIGRPHRLWRWCRRNPVVSSLAAGLAAVLIIGTATASYFAFDARRQAHIARGRADDLLVANQQLGQSEYDTVRVTETLLEGIVGRDQIYRTPESSDTVRESLLDWQNQLMQIVAGRPRELAVKYAVATILGDMGQHDLSIRAMREMVASLDRRSQNWLLIHNSIAMTLMRAGRTDEALSAHRENLTAAREIYGERHSYALRALVNLATAYLLTGEAEQAFPLIEDALARVADSSVEDARIALSPAYQLAKLTSPGSKNELSDEQFRRALRILMKARQTAEDRLGKKNRATLRLMQNLAMVQWLFSLRLSRAESKELTAEAQALAREAQTMLSAVVELRKESFGPGDHDTLSAMNNLATVHVAAGRLQDASEVLEKAIEAARRNPQAGENNDRILSLSLELAEVYERLGEDARCERLLTGVLDDRKRQRRPTIEVLEPLAWAKYRLGKYAECRALLEDNKPRVESNATRTWHAYSIAGMKVACGAQDNPQAATVALASICKRLAPGGDAALPKHKRNRLAHLCAHLATLYEATGEAGQAERWRKIAAAAGYSSSTTGTGQSK